MMRGSCDKDAMGGDGWYTGCGKGGISHGNGMRSSEEGTVLLTGGKGILSCFLVAGTDNCTDMGKDGGNGMLMGSSVSSIRIGSLYCSIDEYSCQCDPQGTRGSSGDATWGGSTSSGLGGRGMGTNGKGSMSGGMFKTTGGSGMTSLGRDENRWIKGRMTGTGPTGGNSAVTGADDGASGIMVMDPPPPPKGMGLGMDIGDLLLIFLLQFLRSTRSPSRNVWSFRV